MWPFTRKRKEKPVTSVEEAMRQTGMSAAQLERLFLEDLVQHGENPFADAPEHIRISLKKDIRTWPRARGRISVALIRALRHRK